ncbi:glutamine synthetase [Rhodobacter veldkampii DSM 11550]|uniref:Glutamine synthetase n=1 Tax=Phaeovulum veldkampii DSM 11550 TaxID=1185920 RepID=A0A2T4JG98_9RHOB|nr:glutamine synthetase family protein [Phaeovulum veldkampii]MBK5946133.1 glutamine synthetase [Phaeovulum veldkampii DSM 11550]PTE16939.1 glutamine synthetase [Phaeovulum veldkampii DSM 11550]TDQ56455.1 glutamate--putrescine ligase [Phaeovulum veldkampii DSM 11550]
MTHSPTGSTLAEAEAFLAAHPEIEAFDIVLHDANGIGRGKIIRRHELAGLYTGGRHLPISILGLDIVGEDVHETGLIWDQGDGDLRAWPIPGTLKALHGTNPPRGEVLMSMYHLDGAEMTSDPRHALARQVRAMADEGVHPAGAFELEFFLLDPTFGEDGYPRPAAAVLDGRRSGWTEVYSVDHLHGMEPLFSDIYRAAEAMGIKAETVISEYAPGQYELTLHYRTDVMQAADDLVRLKRIVRLQARRHGVVACFMAKPIERYAGSGMHFHVSLQDGAGRNVFAEQTEGQWTDTILHALGGLRATMGDSMLVFAPHANSWRRFAAQSYAPVSPSWGVNNRSVALRIPAGAVAARRIEHRPSGVDANPYLVAATVLAGIRHGLRHRIDPGPETTGNGYAGGDDLPIPVDWRQAIRAAQDSAFLKDALGADMHRTFTAIKAAELARVARTIADVDYDLYLHTV